MKNGYISNKALYDLITRRFDKIDIIVEENSKEITVLKIWRANITGKILGGVAVISFIINMGWDWIKEKGKR